jgi:hypothetical protein
VVVIWDSALYWRGTRFVALWDRRRRVPAAFGTIENVRFQIDQQLITRMLLEGEPT